MAAVRSPGKGRAGLTPYNPRVARDPRRPVNLMQVRVFRIAGFWGIVERPAWVRGREPTGASCPSYSLAREAATLSLATRIG